MLELDSPLCSYLRSPSPCQSTSSSLERPRGTPCRIHWSGSASSEALLESRPSPISHGPAHRRLETHDGLLPSGADSTLTGRSLGRGSLCRRAADTLIILLSMPGHETVVGDSPTEVINLVVLANHSTSSFPAGRALLSCSRASNLPLRPSNRISLSEATVNPQPGSVSPK